MEGSLQVLLLLALIIAAAKLGGATSQRFGQAAVLGEMLVGLVLGPTVLNLPQWPFFADHGYLSRLVRDVAELGVIFLMLLAGLETDVKSMRKVGLAATAGAVGGMLLPFLGGFLIGELYGFGGFESVFVGTIMTATSVSISAQTLLELGYLRSRVGNAILGAAVIDDVLGIILLSVVIAMSPGAGSGGEPVWLILVRVAGFFIVGVAAGQWLVPKILHRTRRTQGHEVSFAVALVLGLIFAFSAAYFGRVAAITGSYILGVLIAGEAELKEMVVERLRPLAYGFFVPVFFISVGLEGDLLAALRQAGIVFALLILLAAIVGKVFGAGLGVRPLGFDWEESLQVGTGMVSRGEVGLITAAIGLQSKVISEGIYSVMLVMVIVTTLITPVLLRWAFRRRRRGGTML